MEAKVYRLQKKLDKLEKQLRFHGHWASPDDEFQQIRLSNLWNPEMIQMATLLNRIMRMRSLPVLYHLVGPVSESLPEEFLVDCMTPLEKMDLINREFHLLLEYLDLIPEFDVLDFKEDEEF